MLQQISIYAENRLGMMQNITQILEDAGVNILGSVTNDSAEYGMVRMVVSDDEAAMAALKANHFLCKKTAVLAVEIQDRPGALNKLLKAVAASNINVNYLYLSFDRENATPIIILHTDDVLEVEECLRGKGFVLH